MNKIKKLLAKLNPKDRELLLSTRDDVLNRRWQNLDLRQLKGVRNAYRVRKGKFRIIFIETGPGIEIISIEKRSDNTYKNL
ncbi:MAG: hypothetical protein Q8Q32_03205 [bacterium]|nr:hypothetical protein [bacterium]